MSVLSRAYSTFASKGAGEGNIISTSLPPINGYGLPNKPDDAVKFAQRAASAALSLEPNSPEASNAQGYALAALDVKGKNKRAALAAFAKAVFGDASDAANQLGLGYGIRFSRCNSKTTLSEVNCSAPSPP